MRRFIQALLVSSFVVPGLWITLSGSASPPVASPSFEQVLQAHGGRERILSLASFRADAVRLTHTVPPGFFERHVSVWVDDERFRRITTDPLGWKTRIETFDGRVGLQAVSRSTEADGDTKNQALHLDRERLQAVTFALETFGLLPMLKSIAGPATDVVSHERATALLDKFKLRTPDGDWLVYTDASHLIRRVDMEDKIFQFAGYRHVDGLQLPLVQQVSLGDRLIYELFFSNIELNPSLPAGIFQREALASGIAR